MKKKKRNIMGNHGIQYMNRVSSFIHWINIDSCNTKWMNEVCFSFSCISFHCNCLCVFGLEICNNQEDATCACWNLHKCLNYTQSGNNDQHTKKILTENKYKKEEEEEEVKEVKKIKQTNTHKQHTQSNSIAYIKQQNCFFFRIPFL